MAQTKYPKNPVKVTPPPGPGSYKVTGKDEPKRLDKPQKPPVAKSDRKAVVKKSAGKKPATEKSGGKGESSQAAAAAKQNGGKSDSDNVRPLRGDQGKKE